MALEFNKSPHGVIGACTRAAGNNTRLDATGEEGRLTLGAHLRRGDCLSTGDGAFAELSFLDGTKILLSEQSIIEIEDYYHADDLMEDGAQFVLSKGLCVLRSGEIGNNVNGLSLQVGEIGVSLRAADIAVRMHDVDYDLISLLPGGGDAPGQVLVQGRFNSAVLERLFQTVRLASSDADIAEPLTLPSGVIAETYAGPGMEPFLKFDDLFSENTLEYPSEKPFALFRADENQMFERPPEDRAVYPSEDARHKTPENDFLEDSFVGERFRLSESD